MFKVVPMETFERGEGVTIWENNLRLEKKRGENLEWGVSGADPGTVLEGTNKLHSGGSGHYKDILPYGESPPVSPFHPCRKGSHGSLLPTLGGACEVEMLCSTSFRICSKEAVPLGSSKDAN